MIKKPQTIFKKNKRREKMEGHNNGHMQTSEGTHVRNAIIANVYIQKTRGDACRG